MHVPGAEQNETPPGSCGREASGRAMGASVSLPTRSSLVGQLLRPTSGPEPRPGDFAEDARLPRESSGQTRPQVKGRLAPHGAAPAARSQRSAGRPALPIRAKLWPAASSSRLTVPRSHTQGCPRVSPKSEGWGSSQRAGVGSAWPRPAVSHPRHSGGHLPSAFSRCHCGLVTPVHRPRRTQLRRASLRGAHSRGQFPSHVVGGASSSAYVCLEHK